MDLPPDGKRVPAVERAARILDYVSAAEIPPGAARIAKDLGIAKSSAHGLLGTLCGLGLLTKRPDQSYAVGPHVARWARAFEAQADVSREFAAVWDEGAALPGATITLSVLDGSHVVYIGARNSGRTPWVDFRVGMRLPAAYTATGLAFLSCMSRAEARARVSPLPPPLTPRSAPDVETVLAHVEAARERGWSLDLEQVREGMCCIGAPVMGAAGEPIAGIAVSMPSEELTEAARPHVAAEVLRIARALSARMGGAV